MTFIHLKICFSASIFKINRWHGIKDKINKNEKYTSVTKMVTKCQYNLLVNIKTLSHTNKDLPAQMPAKQLKMQHMRNQVFCCFLRQ